MSKRDASRRGPVVPAVHSKAAACPRAVSGSRPLAIALGMAWTTALALAPMPASAQWVELGYSGDGQFNVKGETYFAKEGRHQLVVTGDAGDVLSLGNAKNGWFEVGTVFKDGAPYVVYDTGTQGPRYEHVQAIVSADVTVDVAPPPGNGPDKR